MFWNSAIEKMSLKDLKNLQLRKLKSTVEYAYRNSFFYKRLYDEAGVKPSDINTLDDLVKLPFVKKQFLRKNYPYGLLAVPLSEVVRLQGTSGTTGKPVIVAYTQNDIELWVDILARSLYCAGVRRNDIFQNAYGYGLFTGGLGYHYAAERIGATVVPASSGNTRRQIELMMDLGTTVIACTPSYMIYLTEYAKKMGIDLKEDTKLRMGIGGAEPWSKELKKKIEDEMGIDPVDIYGTAELMGPGVAVECPKKAGMHCWGDVFIIEVINPSTGEQLEEGEKGELVITVLGKEAMPMIRWRTGDIASITEEKCDCGRVHPRIKEIAGRTDDMFIIKGVNIFPTQVEYALLKIPEVEKYYQIILERDSGGLDTMTIQVEINPKFVGKIDLPLLEKQIAEQLREYLNVTPKIEIMEPGTLPRFEGKAKRIIDRRKI